MSIKPIDLQTNMGQIHEISKGEKMRTDGLVEQQHLLEKESNEQSRLSKSKVEENKKADSAIILRDDQSKRRRREEREKRKRQQDESSTTASTMRDERLGKIIDIKK